MSKSKEVTVQMSDEERRRILAMSGQVMSGSKNFIPKVKVNKNPIDDETENELPVGVVSFMSREHEKFVLAKRKEPVTFTPYAHRMRYEAYDAKANNGKGKVTGRSTLFTDWGEDIVADNGRLRAGKGDDIEGVQVKCKHVFFGLISFNGVDVEGNDVKVENEPVMVQIGGKSFIEYGDLMRKDMANKILCQYDMDLKAVHRGEGIYTMELVFKDMTNPSPWNKEKEDTLETFVAHIKAENSVIEKKFENFLKKSAEPSHSDLVSSDDDDDDLSDDFDEDGNFIEAEYEEVA